MKKIFVVIVVCVIASLVMSACMGTKLNTVVTDDAETPLFKTDNIEVIEREPVGGDEENDIPMNADTINGTTILKYICDVNYGMYPQTKAEKKAVKEMSKATDITGYYFSTYDNEHYAKVSAAVVYGNDYEFMDENRINEGETYYFKVEPIKWRVVGQVDLLTGNVQVMMISDLILDGMEFCEEYKIDDIDNEWYNTESGTFANNWAYSKVREWLNDDFYKVAFTTEEKEHIVARNTSEVCEIFDENDPTENVYTLTYDQAVSLGNTKAQVSDYARCKNTFMSIYPEFYGNGRWWLCTPGNRSYRVAYASDHNLVSSIGADVISASGESAGLECMGVRPVVTLNLTKELLEKIIVIEEEE